MCLQVAAREYPSLLNTRRHVGYPHVVSWRNPISQGVNYIERNPLVGVTSLYSLVHSVAGPVVKSGSPGGIGPVGAGAPRREVGGREDDICAGVGEGEIRGGQ